MYLHGQDVRTFKRKYRCFSLPEDSEEMYLQWQDVHTMYVHCWGVPSFMRCTYIKKKMPPNIIACGTVNPRWPNKVNPVLKTYFLMTSSSTFNSSQYRRKSGSLERSRTRQSGGRTPAIVFSGVGSDADSSDGFQYRRVYVKNKNVYVQLCHLGKKSIERGKIEKDLNEKKNISWCWLRNVHFFPSACEPTAIPLASNLELGPRWPKAERLPKILANLGFRFLWWIFWLRMHLSKLICALTSSGVIYIGISVGLSISRSISTTHHSKIGPGILIVILLYP